VRIGLAFIVGSLVAGGAQAATVRGLVTLPAEPRAADREGHWRVENGVLPVGPRTPDPRADAVVVLEGGPTRQKSDDKPPTLTVDLRGLRMEPRVLVAPAGATINYKNDDRVPHTLFIENAATMMPPEPTPSGMSRSVRLQAPAEYQVRDQEYPHIEGTVVVTDGPAAQVDEKGTFKLDAPEGRYTLKVYWHGAWVHSQPIEVGPHTTDLKIDVPATARTQAGRTP
jgi:hypothetical protein